MSHIFRNLEQYKKPRIYTKVEETPPISKEQPKNQKKKKVKEGFQAGLGCLCFLAMFCLPIIVFTAVDEEVILWIGGIAFACFVLPQLLALLGLPFFIASGMTKSKWKIVIIGIVIIALGIGAVALYDSIKGEEDDFEYEYLDSNRPDKW